MPSVLADHYRGKRVRLAGYIETVEFDIAAAFWLRVDGPGKAVLGFDTTQDRTGAGTTD